jgi:outer membrane protein assembly factor BamB
LKKTNAFLVWLLLICLSCVFPATHLLAEEWPQWRGLNRDGVWPQEGITEKFNSPQLAIKWRAPVSSGYSGPTVADGKVFVTDLVKEPAQQERVHCFDAKTGKGLWVHTYPVTYKKIGYPAGPRAAVTIDNDRAYSLGTMGHIFCLNTEDGSVIWQKDLNSQYSIRMPLWGITAAPLVEDNLVILQIGGKGNACVVALDKKTGWQVWTALEDEASYSAPIIIEHAGKRILLCWSARYLTGLNPLNGQSYFMYDYRPDDMGQNISTPVFYDSYVFMSSFFYGSAVVRLLPGKLEVEEIWRRKGENERNTDSLHCCISTPILEGKYIYGVDSYGQLRCLELLTGNRVWEDLTAVPKARWANIHMVRNGEKIWMFNERGELIISKLSPAGFEEISRAKLIEPTEDQLDQRGGVCWSHPAFAYKNIYARNGREIVCASLAEEDHKFNSSEKGE